MSCPAAPGARQSPSSSSCVYWSCARGTCALGSQEIFARRSRVGSTACPASYAMLDRSLTLPSSGATQCHAKSPHLRSNESLFNHQGQLEAACTLV